MLFCCLGHHLLFRSWIATSQSAYTFWDAFIKIPKKGKFHYIIWMSKAPHSTSLSQFMWIILELLDRWDQNRTLWKWNWSRRLSPYFSLSLSFFLFFFFNMKTKMQEWKWQHNIRKTCLTSFTTTVTNWLNSTCHPTWRNEDLALWKRNKTETKQNNTKQLRINVKMECKCDYRMQ